MSKSYPGLPVGEKLKHLDWPNNFVLFIWRKVIRLIPGEVFGSDEGNNKSFPVKRESSGYVV